MFCTSSDSDDDNDFAVKAILSFVVKTSVNPLLHLHLCTTIGEITKDLFSSEMGNGGWYGIDVPGLQKYVIEQESTKIVRCQIEVFAEKNDIEELAEHIRTRFDQCEIVYQD